MYTICDLSCLLASVHMCDVWIDLDIVAVFSFAFACLWSLYAPVSFPIPLVRDLSESPDSQRYCPNVLEQGGPVVTEHTPGEDSVPWKAHPVGFVCRAPGLPASMFSASFLLGLPRLPPGA